MNQLRAAVGAKPVILVVDDDSAVRDSLKFTLEVEGFEVRAYSSAHELLNDDSLPTVSCLVTDYHMPAIMDWNWWPSYGIGAYQSRLFSLRLFPTKICATVPPRLGFQLLRSQCWAIVCWTPFTTRRFALPSSAERIAPAFMNKRAKESFDPKNFLAKVGEGKAAQVS